MKRMGYEPGAYSTCMYYSKKHDALCWRHGDDFVLLHTRDGHAEFLAEANKEMLLKDMGILGGLPSDKKEVRVLNRIIRHVQPAFKGPDHSYLEWESDPRHLEILSTALGINRGQRH